MSVEQQNKFDEEVANTKLAILNRLPKRSQILHQTIKPIKLNNRATTVHTKTDSLEERSSLEE